MTKEQIEQIEQQAKNELAAEKFREEVEIEKEKLKRKKSFWVKIFPWRFAIYRADQPIGKKNVLVMAAKLRTEGYLVYPTMGCNIALVIGGVIVHHILTKR